MQRKVAILMINNGSLCGIEALHTYTHKVCTLDGWLVGSTLNLATTTTVISTSKPTCESIDDSRGALLRSVSEQHLLRSVRFCFISLTGVCRFYIKFVRSVSF